MPLQYLSRVEIPGLSVLGCSTKHPFGCESRQLGNSAITITELNNDLKKIARTSTQARDEGSTSGCVAISIADHKMVVESYKKAAPIFHGRMV